MRVFSNKASHSWLGCFLLITAIAFTAYSQRKDFNVYDAGNIPRPWQARFKERFDLFIEYHRTKQWDEVSALMGDFYGGRERKKYTPEQKRQMIGQISSRPMLNFTLDKIIFSTEILSKPLSKRWWSIWGEAEYLEDDKSVKRKVVFTAYRYKGEWFFSYQD